MARPFKLNTSCAVLFCASVYYAVLLNVLVYGRNANETFKHYAGLSCSPFHYIVRVGSNYKVCEQNPMV